MICVPHVGEVDWEIANECPAKQGCRLVSRHRGGGSGGSGGGGGDGGDDGIFQE